MSNFESMVQAALGEHALQSKAEIESETAWRWAARAVAAWRTAVKMGLAPGRVAWLATAVEFGHEAIEHGGSAEAGVLAQIRAALAAEAPVLWA